MLTDNLNDSQIKDLLRRVRDLETRSPLRSSSMNDGQLRVGGTAILLVDGDGGLVVEGRLNGDGTLTWVGPVSLGGNTTIKKNLLVEALTRLVGAVTLESDLTVKTAGKITVEGAIPMVLDDAKLKFSSGGTLKGYSGGVVLVANETSGAAIQLDGSDIVLAGSVRSSGITGKTGVTANVHIDSAGRLWKVG